MSGTTTGGGVPHFIVFHPNSTSAPAQIALSDVQAWADSLPDGALKTMLVNYLASIPSE